MSISIGHRAIFTAFGHRNSTATRTHAPSAVPLSPTAGEATRPLEAGVSLEVGELKCSPWEGLYLEQALPFTASGSEAVSRRQLESFLSNLMYGE